MIEIKKLTSTLSEIYSGGGDWLTQSAPTNFHQFYRRRQLLAGESIADWREVTDAEKATLEAQDAAWVEPEQGFVDEWNAACNTKDGPVGKYNSKTGYFELNGLTDISLAEAQTIYEAGRISTYQDMYARYLYCKFRTNLPPRPVWTSTTATLICYGCSNLEVFNTGSAEMNFTTQSFAICSKLHTVTNWNKCGQKGVFVGCTALENINLMATASIDLPASGKLSHASVRYMAEASTSGVTITVHPDVFAKLTGDTTNAAASALTEEELAQWMALPEIAAARNVTFVSA